MEGMKWEATIEVKCVERAERDGAETLGNA